MGSCCLSNCVTNSKLLCTASELEGYVTGTWNLSRQDKSKVSTKQVGMHRQWGYWEKQEEGTKISIKSTATKLASLNYKLDPHITPIKRISHFNPLHFSKNIIASFNRHKVTRMLRMNRCTLLNPHTYTWTEKEHILACWRNFQQKREKTGYSHGHEKKLTRSVTAPYSTT